MKASLDYVEVHGPRVASFYFKPEKPVRYEAGQFVEWTIEHEADSRGIKRWFTVSTAPADGLLCITTRLIAKPSSFKKALQALQPGDTVQVSDPMGDFVLPKDPTIPLVFIAGGIGITPFLSIARQLTQTGEKRRVRLYYIVHAINDALFHDELLMAGFQVNIVLSKQRTGPLLTGIEQVPGSLYYISGPEGLAEKLTDELKAMDIADSQIVTDYFPGY
jgi:ferredoxin-NADP reductase